MNPADIEDLYPLTPMQQGMLFHTLREPGTRQYIEQSVWTFRGPVDTDALRRAWQMVVDRHPVLRTAVVWEGVEEPVQVVCRDVRVPFEVEPVPATGPGEGEEELTGFLRDDRQRDIDLATAPLMRVTVLHQDPGIYHCVWTHHHLILDGWSVPLLMGELVRIYGAFIRSETPILPPVSPFREYITWLGKRDPGRARAFWTASLEGFSGPVDLRLARRRVSRSTGAEYRRTRTQLDASLSAAVHQFCRTEGLTLSTVVQACWGLLVSRYAGVDDVVFGATVSGRPADLPGAETMLGLFINTIPVRVRPRRSASVRAWLHDHQRRMSETDQFAHTSLADIQRWAGQTGGEGLFNTLLVVENFPVGAAGQDPVPGLVIEPGPSYTRTNYPLTMAITPGTSIGIEIGYDASALPEETASAIPRHCAVLLRQMTGAPDAPVSSLALAGRGEAGTVGPVHAGPVSGGECADIMDAIRLHAVDDPTRAAIDDGREVISYGTLDRVTDQIARVLVRRGIGPESVVAIMPDRSVSAILTILGIMKAGGAYLPVEASLPAARIRFLLEEAQAALLVVAGADPGAEVFSADQTIRLDALRDASALERDTPVRSRYDPESAAYIIFTSGSTGTPKGVVVSRRGIAHLATEMQRTLGLTPADRSLHFLSLTFDAAGEEIFPAVVAGATVVVHPHPSKTGPQEFLKDASAAAITVAHLPTAFWHVLSEHCGDRDATVPPTLRVLVVGGESPSAEALRRWMNKAPVPSTFLNVYGPTETTVAASAWGTTVEGAPDGIPDPIPIGVPLGDMVIYVLDQEMHPLPRGVTGELYIAGEGVSRGYLRRPGQTAEVFVPDPFTSVPGSRMYRTGDTGYRRDDGSLVFTGRRDRQCKIRGFRIEPGEVEGHLRSIAGVRNAVVMVREDQPGERRLVGYLDAPALQGASVESILASLRRALPDHLIPAAVVVLDALPLTAGGKIDQRSLPAPGAVGSPDDPPDPPRGTTETIIAGIWEDVLQVRSVRREDGFFALGGHSLLAIRLLYRLRDAFSLDLSMADVFESRTLADLAQRIDARLRDPALESIPVVLRADRSGVIPLSFAQQRLWFLDQLQPGGSVYTIPSLFRLAGMLDRSVFEQALAAVIRRHESLRTSYQVIDGVPVQHILPPDEAVPDLVYRASEGVPFTPEALRETIAAEIRTPFRLDEGPLLRVRLYRLAESEHILLLAIHHSIADGWSVGLLMRDLCEAYDAFLRNGAFTPSALPYQYADFAVWQRRHLTDDRVQVLLGHWRRHLDGIPSVSTLPADRPRPASPSFAGAVERHRSDAVLVQEVRGLAQRENATPFMTLLAAFACLAYRYSGQRDLVIGTPVAGRVHEAFDRVVGFFVNSLPLRAVIDPARSFADLVRDVRDEAVGAFAHQDLPFDRLVEDLHPVRNLAHAPVFQMVFALQDMPPVDLAPAGLQVTGLEVPGPSSGFDLSLEVLETPEGYHLACTYAAELFDARTVARLLEHYVRLTRMLVQNPDVPVSAVPLLSPEEWGELVVAWNRTSVPFDESTTVHGRFRACVDRQPDAIAVAFRPVHAAEAPPACTLTYAELDRRAEQIARRLYRAGVRTGDLVGICMDRSADLVSAVLGALKAGAGFVPLDPGYPPERIRFMVEEARPRTVLVHTHASVPDLSDICPVQDPCGAIGEETAADGVVPAARRTEPDDLAYVIFTSGSTGKPKGTLLAHRGLVNLAAAQAVSFCITPADRILQFSSLSFDASVWELVMALLNGAGLWLTDRETIGDPAALAALMDREKITVVTLPPSILAAFPSVDLPSLGTIIVAGERCPAELVARWAPGRRFVNAYGPTETTVCASLCICGNDTAGSPPIGRPLQNVQTYIVDRDLQPVPVGVPGELLVGGAGLAYGYLGRADITAERFIPDPFGGRGVRLYRTGDRCRYLPDGNIEFIGRIDQQVKIRGFRIEPGEVEAVVGAIPGVRDAAVVPRGEPGGDVRLVAYVVLEEGSPLDGSAIRAAARQRLPEFMLPSVIVRLDAMPLTASGKIDRAALPAPHADAEMAAAAYVAPRTGTEEALAAMVQELLQCGRVGVLDNFFDLGGHSLLATQLVSRINGRWGTAMALRAVFEQPTIGGMAAVIDAAAAGPAMPSAPIAAVPRERVRIARTQLTADRMP